MIRKNFLSGIFSVVSFILVSNLVIPSTFALCPPDVSGKWVLKAGITHDCPPKPLEVVKASFVVVQTGDVISASWNGGREVLTGVVNGNSVYFKVEDSGNGPCGAVNHFVGIIKGNQIKGYGTGTEVGGGDCNDKWHFTFNIKIVK